MKVLPLALPFALALGSTPSIAAESFDYHLGQESSIWAGCLPPCQCPAVFQDVIGGSFKLEPDEFDGTFQHYRVTDLIFAIGNTDTPVALFGSGTYKVSGDQQQLVLDLTSSAGLEIQHYDSGLTGGGASFPRIKLPVAQHGFYCNDVVLGIESMPAGATEVPPSPTVPTFSFRLGPNPFRGSTGFVFSLPASGAVDLRIHDLAGREVKALATGHYGSGPHTVTWDGRNARGARASAGVYFVLLRAAGRESRGTIVKLD